MELSVVECIPGSNGELERLERKRLEVECKVVDVQHMLGTILVHEIEWSELRQPMVEHVLQERKQMKKIKRTNQYKN